MAYGIEIFNVDGLKVLDFERTLYVKDTGNLVAGNADYYLPAVTAYPTARRMAGPLDYPMNYPAQFAFAAGATARYVIETRVPWAGFEHVNSGGTDYVYPVMNMTPGDLIFCRVDTWGMYTQWNAYLDRAGFGSVRGTSCINTEGNNALPFIHASPNPPAGALSEQYGVQLFDAAGQSVFDSRRPIFSVFQAVLVSGASLSNLISTGTPIDITLNKSTPGAYVAAPYMSSFFSVTPGAGSTWLLQSAMLKQTSATNLRLTRETLLTHATPSGTTRSFSQDLFILIGRPL